MERIPLYLEAEMLEEIKATFPLMDRSKAIRTLIRDALDEMARRPQ